MVKYLSILSCCLPIFVFTQIDQNIEQQLEEQSEQADFVFLDETYLENKAFYLKHPVSLNKADEDELVETTLFSNLQIQALLEHINQNGKLISIYELQAIPHFDVDFIKQILPYVKVNSNLDVPHAKWDQLLFQGDHQLFIRFKQQFKTNSTDNYIGHPAKLYVRYKHQFRTSLSYGLTLEKDEGEAFFTNNTKGFDFYSYHFYWKLNKKLKTIALGDYQLNLGQGLVVWTGFGFNKSAQTTSIKKEGPPIKAYSSVNEVLFLRGVAMHFSLNKLTFTPFISYKKTDATIYQNENNQIAASIALSGLHRTTNELNKKKKIKDLKMGFSFSFGDIKRKIAANLLHQYYPTPIYKSNDVYKQYHFEGSHLSNLSFSYHYLIKKGHFFGEQAFSLSNKKLAWAYLHGVMLHPDPKWEISILHRYYSYQYQTLYYTNAFGESSRPQNELGWYWGNKIHLNSKWNIQSYIDLYYFKWPSFSIDKSGNGIDIFLRINGKINKKLQCYWQYKYEQKSANVKPILDEYDRIWMTNQNQDYFREYWENDTTLNSPPLFLEPNEEFSKQALEKWTVIVPTQLQKLRFHLSFSPLSDWTFQSRIEISHYKDPINASQMGFSIYQDLNYKSMGSKWSGNTRFSVFSISAFNSRIYNYENGVLYQFSIPALQHSGFRWYVNLSWKVHQNFQIWAKYGITHYTIDEIENTNVHDLSVQCRYRF